MNRLTSALITLLLVGSLVAGGAVGTASAATDDEWPDKPRSATSKPKAFMLNILGSVLGAASPKKLDRARMAANNRYNYGWESLEARHGMSTARSKGLLNGSIFPDTPDDYAFLDTAKKHKGKWATAWSGAASKMQTPVTAVAKFGKGVLQTGGALIGYDLALMGVDGGFEFFGIDRRGTVCSGTDNGFVQWLAGVDCTDFWGVPPEYLDSYGATCIPRENGVTTLGLYAWIETLSAEDIRPDVCEGYQFPIAVKEGDVWTLSNTIMNPFNEVRWTWSAGSSGSYRQFHAELEIDVQLRNMYNGQPNIVMPWNSAGGRFLLAPWCPDGNHGTQGSVNSRTNSAPNLVFPFTNQLPVSAINRGYR